MASTFFQVRYYDRDNPSAVPILEPAKKGSITLDFKGADDKIQTIIGSTCVADVLDPASLDGKFTYFYTSDETRWLTQIWMIEPDAGDRETLFWQGHIMPEQYEEPYTTNNLFVKVLATDGLGRLKGKYLDDTFYSDEHTVLSALSACLEATGNDFELYFAPAIINAVNRYWHEVWVSGESFRESVKDDGTYVRKTCYKILEELLETLQCVCYQDWGRWFIVGYNIQPIESYRYHHYDATGNYLNDVTINRTPYNVKPVQLTTPNVGIRTPYKEITVRTPIQETVLPTALVEAPRDGWVLPAPLTILNVGERLLFRHWLVEGYNNTGDATGWTPVVRPKDGILNLGLPRNADNAGRYVRLDRRLYVEEGQKLKAGFDFDYPLDLGQGVNIIIAFVVDDEAGNVTEVLQEVRFDADRLLDVYESYQDQLTKEWVVRHNGYLDVHIFKPTSTGTTTRELFLKDLSIEDVDYSEEFTASSVINEDYSIIEDIPLPYGDDVRGATHSFRLAALEDRSVDLYTKVIAIQSVFAFEGKEYVVLDLRELFFVKDFPTRVQVRQGGVGAFVTVPSPEVTYNFMNGEQMVFSYDAATLGFVIGTGDVLQVLVKDYVYPTGDRAGWQQWVDGVYDILPKRYGAVVTDIYRNLYQDPHLYLDISLKNIVTFSSLISFNFQQDRTFYPLNLRLQLDTGRVTGRFNEAFYGREVTDNIPPIVDAGSDQELAATDTTADLLATESDPDGVIVSRLWEVVSGVATITSTGTLATGITGIGSDVVTFRITVTDDDGATASDTVTLRRVAEFTINNTILEDTNDVDPENQTVVRKERLVFAPVIPSGELVTIDHNVLLQKTDDPAGAITSVFFECRKNGVLVSQMSDAGTDTFTISYINGDVIEYEVSSDSQTGPGLGSTSGLSRVRLQNISFQTGLGTVTNSPYTIQASSSVSG